MFGLMWGWGTCSYIRVCKIYHIPTLNLQYSEQRQKSAWLEAALFGIAEYHLKLKSCLYDF